jgi:hypothetical protein
MQFGIGMLSVTKGPQETPPQLVSVNLGSIISMLPMLMLPTEFSFDSKRNPLLGSHTIPPKPAGEMAPPQLASVKGGTWVQNTPVP